MLDQKIIIILTLGTFSLVATTVLFRKLESYAKGKGKVLGHTIQYGGSIGGFILIFGLLIGAYRLLEPAETQVDLNGKWDMIFTREDTTLVSGTAQILQVRGNRSFSITGEVPMALDPGYVSFSTPVAAVNGMSIIFVYVNSRGEQGVAKGILLVEKPNEFTVNYYDINDENLDSKGRITFKRTG